MTAAHPPCRIALCDDVASFRMVLSIVLGQDASFEVVGEAANGAEAVDLVAGTDVDVLLLDIAMPVMDGMEALPLVLERSPDTKVIMLTGFGSTELRERSLALGASHYIEKGADPSSIIGVVREVCAQQC